MTFLYVMTIIVFLLVAFLLCSVILMQESKSGGGLGASFGGDTTSSVFGTSTADVLKKITAYLAAIFLGLCVVLSLWTASMGRQESSTPYDIEQID